MNVELGNIGLTLTRVSPVYDIGSLDFTKNDSNRLSYEPTAVLANNSNSNPKDKRIRLKDMLDLDFSR